MKRCCVMFIYLLTGFNSSEVKLHSSDSRVWGQDEFHLNPEIYKALTDHLPGTYAHPSVCFLLMYTVYRQKCMYKCV